MTINIDSLWVLLGIGVTLGAGGYLGVLYMVLFIRAGKMAGSWVADNIVIPLVDKVKLRLFGNADKAGE